MCVAGVCVCVCGGGLRHHLEIAHPKTINETDKLNIIIFVVCLGRVGGGVNKSKQTPSAESPFLARRQRQTDLAESAGRCQGWKDT